jgi:hypothetical protein
MFVPSMAAKRFGFIIFAIHGKYATAVSGEKGGLDYKMLFLG